MPAEVYIQTGARTFFQVDVQGASLEIEAPYGMAEVGQGVRLSASTAHAFPLEA